jgi:hypothetical protein
VVIDLDQLQLPNPGLKSEGHPLKMGSGTVGRSNQGLFGKRKRDRRGDPFSTAYFDCGSLELDAQRQLQHAGSIV